MTPAQIAHARHLSLAWRRRLAEQPGAGVRYSPHGHVVEMDDGGLRDDYLRDGWAWLPSSPLAWLEATGQVWGVERDSTGAISAWLVLDDGQSARIAYDTEDPIETALAFMLENPCPST